MFFSFVGNKHKKGVIKKITTINYTIKTNKNGIEKDKKVGKAVAKYNKQCDIKTEVKYDANDTINEITTYIYNKQDSLYKELIEDMKNHTIEMRTFRPKENKNGITIEKDYYDNDSINPAYLIKTTYLKYDSKNNLSEEEEIYLGLEEELTTYTYDSNGNEVVSRNYSGHHLPLQYIDSSKYNRLGLLIEYDYFDYKNDDSAGIIVNTLSEIRKTFYEYSNYDSNGNWLTAIQYNESHTPEYFTERKIEYYQ